MIEQPRKGEHTSAEEAPELQNAEQDEDESAQAQTVANDALTADDEESPLDSEKSDEPGEVMDDSTQDLVDHMRDMEQSGRIDMGAYLGEPNMDDEDDTLGEGHDPDED